MRKLKGNEGLVRGRVKVSRWGPKKWEGGHLQVKSAYRMGCISGRPGSPTSSCETLDKFLILPRPAVLANKRRQVRTVPTL